MAILTTVTAAAGEDRMAAAIGAMGATLGPEEEGMATLTTVTAAAGLPTTKEVAHRPHPVAPRDMYGGRRLPPILSASLLMPARKPRTITAKPQRARPVAATTALTLAYRATSGARLCWRPCVRNAADAKSDCQRQFAG
jgi:hypothetical protein